VLVEHSRAYAEYSDLSLLVANPPFLFVYGR